jgi:hypothetical protein
MGDWAWWVAREAPGVVPEAFAALFGALAAFRLQAWHERRTEHAEEAETLRAFLFLG